MPKIDEEMQKEAEAQPTFDADTVFASPAYFSNRSYVTLTPMGVRITFTEQYGDGAEQARQAVYLNYIDALAFRDLLSNQLTKLVERISEAPEADEAVE